MGENMKKHKSRSLLESFKHASEGIREAILSERNLRIHFLIGVLVITASLFLDVSGSDVLWLIFAVFSVIGAELINTLVEGLTDLYSTDPNPMIKFVKDVAAGIVLWYSLFSVVVGTMIFGKALFGWKESVGKILAWIVLVFFPCTIVQRLVKKHGKSDKGDDSR
jgi:diacylglycerol kinase